MLFASSNCNLNLPTENEQYNRRTTSPVTSRIVSRNDGISIITNDTSCIERDFNYSQYFPVPLYHLRGKEELCYTNVPPVETLDIFQVSLELFNRKGVRPMKIDDANNDMTDICQYFFYSVGKAKVTPKFCSECRGVPKQRRKYALYYVNLVEIARERTARCSTCMYQLLREHVIGEEEEMREELHLMRALHPNGVLVNPFLISCGY